MKVSTKKQRGDAARLTSSGSATKDEQSPSRELDEQYEASDDAVAEGFQSAGDDLSDDDDEQCDVFTKRPAAKVAAKKVATTSSNGGSETRATR